MLLRKQVDAAPSDPLLLKDTSGKERRIDPSMQVRVELTNGTTDWVGAHRLHLSAMELRVRGLGRTPWDRVLGIQLRYLDGADIFLGIITAGLYVLLLGGTAAGASAISSDLGDVVGDVVGAAASSAGRSSREEVQEEPAGPDETEEGPLGSPTGPSRRLFSAYQGRRNRFGLSIAMTAGTELKGRNGFSQGVSAGLRLFNTFELMGGFRHVFTTPQDNLRSRYLGFGRAGVHLNLDQDHRFAVPMFFEMGAGRPVRFFLRFGFGLRVRLADKIYLGLLPVNATFTLTSPDRVSEFVTVPSGSDWRFPSMLELSATF